MVNFIYKDKKAGFSKYTIYFQSFLSCNLSVIYVTISDLNEANEIYSTQELVTFLDVLYPQIEQISKVICRNLKEKKTKIYFYRVKICKFFF